jgi:hypothetical protein
MTLHILCSWIGSLCLLIGCAEEREPQVRASELRSELSRRLDPPVVVAPDSYVGASMAAALEESTQGCTETTSPTGTDCAVSHYVTKSAVIAVYEACAGHYSRLFLYQGDAELVWRALGDMDDDDRIDAWMDPASGGLLIEDRNRDGLVDARTESFERLGDGHVIEGFEGWTPPAHLGEQILEDTDHDGRYDRETITAGEDPKGNPSYWQSE